MHEAPENVDIFLPYGEALRVFMEQRYISKADLKATLKSRGVFLNRNEKEDSIPILISCLLGPQEFDQLRESYQTREDTPKKTTRVIDWDSNRSLLDALPSDLVLNDLIKDYFVNYEIAGNPSFIPIGKNPDSVRLDFEIERRDLSKCWCRSKSKFKGKIELQKIYEGKRVKLLLTHTAEETKELGHKIGKRLTQHFRDSKDIRPDADMRRILFTDFDNESRILFFWSLTGANKTSVFTFEETTDFDACPDTTNPLPEDIKWMEKRVRELRLKGKNLHETFFIKQKEYHKHFLFFRMEARFSFEFNANKGTCVLAFEFSPFSAEEHKNAEFQTNVVQLHLAPGCAHVNKRDVEEHLLRNIELFSFNQYEKLKTRQA